MDFVTFGSHLPASSQLELQCRAFLEGAPTPVPPRSPVGSEAVIKVERFGRVELMPLEDIDYVEADEDYTVLVRRDGRRVDHYKAIGVLEATLPPTFARIHKSYLVRLASVVRVTTEPGARYFAVLVSGVRLPVSRSRYRGLLMLIKA